MILLENLKIIIFLKNISLYDNNISLEFQEKVHALTLFDFSEMIQKSGMAIIDIFGNYNLDDFDASKSERLILIAKK